MHYSAFSLLKQALTGNRGWTRAWRNPEPKKQYDVVIIGGGGHGLATAYYLASRHGIRNVAVLEKGYIGSGNTGRNTTIVRSNYLLNANSQFYEHSMKLWEGLSQDLNYNVMFSQRGVLNLFHTDAQRDAAAASPHIGIGPETWDLPTLDGLHFNDAAAPFLLERWCTALVPFYAGLSCPTAPATQCSDASAGGTRLCSIIAQTASPRPNAKAQLAFPKAISLVCDSAPACCPRLSCASRHPHAIKMIVNDMQAGMYQLKSQTA